MNTALNLLLICCFLNASYLEPLPCVSLTGKCFEIQYFRKQLDQITTLLNYLCVLSPNHKIKAGFAFLSCPGNSFSFKIYLNCKEKSRCVFSAGAI